VFAYVTCSVVEGCETFSLVKLFIRQSY